MFRVPAMLRRAVLLLFASTFAVAVGDSNSAPVPGHPPETKAVETKEMLHGTEIVDPYRWLEDQNSPETRTWIDAQNSYTMSLLSQVTGREALKQRLAAFMKIDAMGPPFVRNGRYFVYKRSADQDQFVLYLRRGLQGKDEVLIDPLKMSPDHTVTISANSITEDGKLLGYSVRHGGEDEVTPHLFDVDARKDLSDSLPKARYNSISISNDKTTVYYVRLMKEGPRLFVHKIGSDPGGDAEIFGNGYGPDKILGCNLSNSNHYLLCVVSYGSASLRTDVYLQDLRKKGPFAPIVNDVSAAFFPRFAGDRLFLRTNWNAPRWRLMEVELLHPSRDQWREVIPESDSVLDSFSAVGGKLAVELVHNVISRVKIFDTNGKFIREITPPTIGSLSNLNGRWESNEAFYSFSSFHVPSTFYRYDVASGKQSVWYQYKVPIQMDQYEVEQVWYNSKDGTKIPMFLAHRKGIKLDGSNPVLLSGYGGFDVSETPYFSAFVASWMAGGGVYALPNLRGGGEFGEDWHRAGMLEKKQNVFDDFISAAEWLIQNHYTTPALLGITGGSNGGLLVGAAITQRADLFGVAICRFPLLDMLRYQQFLVGKYWVPEYGSAENPEQFKYLLAYSPYHHVKAGTAYPPVLFVSGDSDTRVAPLHARKMTALLQASSSSGKPVLLHYDTTSGHSGGTPLSKQIEDSTDELAFLYWQLGLKP